MLDARAIAHAFAGTAAFARQMWSEGRAARLAWTVPAYTLALGLAGWALPYATEADRQRAVLEFAVIANAALVLPFVAAVAASTLSREFTSRVELAIAVKPARAVARIAGKWLALALWSTLLAAGHTAIGAIAIAIALSRTDAAPTWSAPWTLERGEARVLRAGQGDGRTLGEGEAFTPESEDHPVWTFRDEPGRRAGPVRIVVALALRQIGFTTDAGLVFLHARRGGHRPVSQRHEVFADRPLDVVVSPPGEGALVVMLTASGGTAMYPASHSVAVATGRGSWLPSYALAQLAVLMAAWLTAAIALAFSATCSTRVAALYAAIALVGSAAHGPMVSAGAVLADGDRALAQLESSLGSRGEDVSPGALPTEPRAREAWQLAGALIRGLAFVLPDLGRHDLTAPLAAGSHIDGSLVAPLVRQLAWYLPVALALAAAGVAWTGREGRR